MTTIIIFIVHFDSSSRTWRWWRRLSSLPSTTRAPTAPSTCTRLVTTNNRIRPFTRHVDFAARKLHQFSAAVWRFFRQIIVFSSLVKIWFAVSTRNFVGVHFTVLRKNSIWARAFVKSNLYSLKCWSHVEASIIFCRSSVSITIYKILNTTQPSYLYDLISIQPPHGHNTRSSPYVNLIKPSSSLKVTHRSFRRASPHLWNQLPTSFRIPGSICYTLLSPSITFSLFHSELKTSPLVCFCLSDWSHGSRLFTGLICSSVLCFSSIFSD